MKESLPILQQRMAVPVPRVPTSLQKPSIASKSIPPPTSNTSSLPVVQTSGPQPSTTLPVTQKPTVSQQQASSISSSSPNVTIKQQSIQQVPHSLPHSHVSISSPATAVAPSGPAATTPLMEIKKEAGLDEVALPAQAAPTSASHLHTDTKDFLTSTKEELMDGTMDDKTGEYIFINLYYFMNIYYIITYFIFTQFYKNLDLSPTCIYYNEVY